MGCNCREPKKTFPGDFCQWVESQGPVLPILVTDGANGVQLQVAFGGTVLDLFDAVQTYGCKTGNARAVRGLLSTFQALGATSQSALQDLALHSLAGKTIGLARLEAQLHAQLTARRT